MELDESLRLKDPSPEIIKQAREWCQNQLKGVNLEHVLDITDDSDLPEMPTFDIVREKHTEEELAEDREVFKGRKMI